MHVIYAGAAILLLMVLVAAGVAFTDISPAASQVARVAFYLLLALFVLLIAIGFIVVRKVTSLARGFGMNVSLGGLLAMWKWIQLLRKGRGLGRRRLNRRELPRDGT